MARRELTKDEKEWVEFNFKYLLGNDDFRDNLSDVDVAASLEQYYRHDGKLSDAQLDLLRDIVKRY